MFQDDKRPDAASASDDIDHQKRSVVKATAWLALSASLGLVGCSRKSEATLTESDTPATPPPAPWGDPATLVSAIGAGTLAVASVDESVEAYKKGFGYVEYWRGEVPAEMAGFWGVSAMANRKAAVIGPPDSQRGFIRIVELGADFQVVPYHATLGWLALEIQVRSPDELVAHLEGSPSFVHTGGPKTVNGRNGEPLYRAAQFTGPSGEHLLMNQHMLLEQLSPSTPNNVGPLFMLTANAYPYQPTMDLYQNTLRMKKSLELDLPRTSLVKELGATEDQDRKFKMGALRTPEYGVLQIDEYPQITPQRAAKADCFAPGVSMGTFTTHDLDAVKAALQGADVRFTEIAKNSMPPFVGSRALFCVGHSGERIEIVEVRKA